MIGRPGRLRAAGRPIAAQAFRQSGRPASGPRRPQRPSDGIPAAGTLSFRARVAHGGGKSEPTLEVLGHCAEALRGLHGSCVYHRPRIPLNDPELVCHVNPLAKLPEDPKAAHDQAPHRLLQADLQGRFSI